MAAGRRVLITGGNKGIGLAIAHRLRDAGHTVATLDRGGHEEPGIHSIVGDVTSREDVEAGFARFEELTGGVVEVLVANAGITRDTLLMRMSDEEFEAVLDVNLRGVFRCARAATKGMVKNRWGRMIFMGSVVGLLGSAGQVNYAASKTALVGMARSITRELGARGITANVVAPGFIETAMTDVLSDEQRAGYLAQIPARRLGAVDDVAATVAFLASEGASYISGAVIPVDGGLGMGH